MEDVTQTCSALHNLLAIYQCHGEALDSKRGSQKALPWELAHHNKQQVGDGAGAGFWRYPVAPLPGINFAFAWSMERSEGPQVLWGHMEVFQGLNSKAKPWTPELGQPLKDWPIVATCFTGDFKGPLDSCFYFAFVYYQALVVGGVWKGLWPLWEMDSGRAYFLQLSLGSLGDCECGPLSFLVFGLALYWRGCGGQEEGQKPYSRPPNPWFALFNIWEPCLFVPQPLELGRLLLCLFFLFLHSHPPNSDLTVVSY